MWEYISCQAVDSENIELNPSELIRLWRPVYLVSSCWLVQTKMSERADAMTRWIPNVCLESEPWSVPFWDDVHVDSTNQQRQNNLFRSETALQTAPTLPSSSGAKQWRNCYSGQNILHYNIPYTVYNTIEYNINIQHIKIKSSQLIICYSRIKEIAAMTTWKLESQSKKGSTDSSGTLTKNFTSESASSIFIPVFQYLKNF